MRLRVNWRASVEFVGTLLQWLVVPLTAPLVVAVLYGESVVPFLVPLLGSGTLGVVLERLPTREELGGREAFLMVALAWLVIAVVGAVPFVLSGEGALSHPVNALFESTSGVTTTGATVVVDFEPHSRAIMLWRQVLQWLGGLGILVLAISVFSQLSIGGAQLMETETRTQNVQKLTPHIEGTARLLWKLYAAITLLCAVALYALNLVGLAPEMTPFDAVAHAMSGVATAGFSPQPESMGAFSPAAQWTMVPFMAVGATNFVLVYYFVQGEWSSPLDSEEFRFYVGVLAGASVLLGSLLLADPDVVVGLEPRARHAVFQVVSITTTTGFATVDYTAWSSAAKLLLLVLMFLGGMAGSTTCSIKLLRWLIVVKSFRRDLYTAIHPRSVRPVRLSGEVVDEDTIRDVYSFTLVSILLFFLGATFLAVEGARAGSELSEFDAMGASAATFFNVGPAFGTAGPFGNYAGFSTPSKLVMVLLMWVGRIEILPVLVLFTRSYWTS